MGLVTSKLRRASIIAKTDCKVAILTDENFNSIVTPTIKAKINKKIGFFKSIIDNYCNNE